MSESPQVSVVVPAYNEADYIEQCVRSVLEQEASVPFEMVVCDDASADETRSILRSLESEYDALRVLENDENRGMFPTSERLVNAAESDRIVRMDADSYMKPGTVQALSEAFDAGADIVYGKIDVANTQSLHPAASQVGKEQGRATWWGGACMGVRRGLLSDGTEEVDGIGPKMKYLGPKHQVEALDVDVTTLEDVGVYSNFPTDLQGVLRRKYESGTLYIVECRHSPENFSLSEMRGPLFWTVFAAVAVASLRFSKLRSLAALLLCIPLLQYGRDAPLAVDISDRESFYLLYPLYKSGSGLARTAGIWRRADALVDILARKWSLSDRSPEN
ncbi:glycosyltransferase family 2 protein [Halorientalis litorea]|uniref:glycosyltransferase family 2 protein n=1 Tax=Halorientalis litorea TaxID=2931977 RepID=UPI001FF63219|nr:glycosyltransferase family 2 protein [Halorientalis litorea]